MIRRLLPFLVFVALAGLLFAGIRLNMMRDIKEIPSPLIGKPAPDFSLPGLHEPGVAVSRAALLGRPWLLNVWASWCVACQAEHQVLSAYAARNEVLLVGLNYKDVRSDALRWLQQFGDPYAQIAADESGRVGMDYGVYGAPETFLVDPQGIIRFKHIGPLTAEIIEAKVRPLLAEFEKAGS